MEHSTGIKVQIQNKLQSLVSFVVHQLRHRYYYLKIIRIWNTFNFREFEIKWVLINY